MFDSVGWGELLVLVVAGLFILGPDRLPEAAAWLGKTVRQVRNYATGAREQLRSELGPEFDDLRKPLEDLRGLRNTNPRSAVTKHLFDGDDPMNDYSRDRVNGKQSTNGSASTPPTTSPPHSTPPAQPPLSPGERPPYDADAT